MENLLSNEKLTFDINQWLISDQEDLETVYEMPVNHPNKPKLDGKMIKN